MNRCGCLPYQQHAKNACRKLLATLEPPCSLPQSAHKSQGAQRTAARRATRVPRLACTCRSSCGASRGQRGCGSRRPGRACTCTCSRTQACVYWTVGKEVGAEMAGTGQLARPCKLVQVRMGGAACNRPRPTNERCCCAPAGDHISCSVARLQQQRAPHLCQLASSLVVTLRATWLACGADEEGSGVGFWVGAGNGTESRRRRHLPHCSSTCVCGGNCNRAAVAQANRPLCTTVCCTAVHSRCTPGRWPALPLR